MASGIETEGVSQDEGVHDLRWGFFPSFGRFFLPGCFAGRYLWYCAPFLSLFFFFFTKSYSSEKISCAL
jgi:hypothetical protein